MKIIAALSIALLALTACQSMVLTGVQEASHAVAESRSVGEVIDDAAIYTSINHHYLQADVNDLLPNVNVVVRRGRVLLTGIVKNANTPSRAVNLAWKVKGVSEVINELEVDTGSSLITRAQDEWIEKQVEAKLALTKDVNVLNYSIEVVNAKVYLLGVVVNDQELKNALAVSRRIRGVKQVISHLRMAEPHEIITPDPTDSYPDIEYQR